MLGPGGIKDAVSESKSDGAPPSSLGSLSTSAIIFNQQNFLLLANSFKQVSFFGGVRIHPSYQVQKFQRPDTLSADQLSSQRNT